MTIENIAKTNQMDSLGRARIVGLSDWDDRVPYTLIPEGTLVDIIAETSTTKTCHVRFDNGIVLANIPEACLERI